MTHMLDNRGFTLIELMLAMGLFSIILTLSTVGFIGINRTYTRTAIKRELSQSIQTLNTDVTDTLRNPQAEVVKVCGPRATDSDGCHASAATSLCMTGARYIWDNNGGLKRDSQTCDKAVVSPTTIISDRFVIADLRISYVGDHLFRARGVIRTTDPDAFTISDNNGSINTDPAQNPGWDPLTSPYKIKCKGTSAGTIVQSCAVQSFDFIINSRTNIL